MQENEVCDDQIRMREKGEQETEKSEAPQRNKKKKSDTPERKSDTHETERESDTHERKSNCFVEASEVRKMLLASKISTDNSNELTIYVSPSV